MSKMYKIKRWPVSMVRERLTQLERHLEPGEILEISRHDKPYAVLQLVAAEERYKILDAALAMLPLPSAKKRRTAEHAEKWLYE